MFLSILTNTITLASLAIACVCCIVGFALCRRGVGGKYLDEICSLPRAQALVDGLSDEQARKHLYVTCCLDTIFPICYGLMFAGAALRVSPLNGLWPALPAALAGFCDLMENSTHLFALTKKRVSRMKPLFSVLKFTFFILALPFLVFLCFSSVLNLHVKWLN